MQQQLSSIQRLSEQIVEGFTDPFQDIAFSSNIGKTFVACFNSVSYLVHPI